MKKIIVSLLLCVLLSGCARVSEVAKTLWGSSTRALENARVDAVTQTFSCSYSDCWDETLSIAGKEKYKVFIKDKIEGHIILMGIKGNVNTTEVGIFFVQLKDQQLKIEISSLSSSAKTKVSEIIFPRLDEKF